MPYRWIDDTSDRFHRDLEEGLEWISAKIPEVKIVKNGNNFVLSHPSNLSIRFNADNITGDKLGSLKNVYTHILSSAVSQLLKIEIEVSGDAQAASVIQRFVDQEQQEVQKRCGGHDMEWYGNVFLPFLKDIVEKSVKIAERFKNEIGGKRSSVANLIRRFAEESKPETSPDLEMHDVRIYFSAPKPTDATTITKEPKKEFAANFQWVGFQALVQDLRDENYYIYRTSLQPWGDGKRDGTVIGSNSAMKPDDSVELRIGPEDVEKTFRNVVIKPDLFPYRRNPALQVVYVNVHRTDLKNPKEGTEYSSKEFEQNFGNDFYVVLRKDRKFQNPLGGPIQGAVGEPKEAGFTETLENPQGKKLVLLKLRGGRPTDVQMPKKGPGSYRRQEKHRMRWMPVAGLVRGLVGEISTKEDPDGI